VSRVGRLAARGAVVRQALRNPDLRRVLAAYLLFNIAEWATWIALLVWGYGVGGVRGASAIALVQLVPAALLAAPAAALVGRHPRGRALALGYAAQAVGYVALGVALLADAAVGTVGLTAAAVSVTVTLTRPAHHALLPEISRTTGDLTVGNSASGSLEAVAAFLGPLTSGLVLAAWSAGGVLVVMGGCSLVAALLTARLAIATSRRGAVRRAGTGDRTRALRTVLRHPAARLMVLLITAENVLVGMMDILLVVLALDALGMSDAGPGILSSALGVGGIVGAALTIVLVGRPRLAGPLVLAAVCAGVAFALAGQTGVPVLAMCFVAVTGAGKLFYDVTSRTFTQRLVPDHLLAATFGLQESFAMTGIALGTLAAPALVATVGADVAFVVAGGFLPLAALASYRALRRLDAGTAVPVDVLALLTQVPILVVLPPRVLERLARDATGQQVPAGTRIVGQGEPGARFFVIAAGRVRVDIDGAAVRELGAGDWFGEIALLRDVPRTASVTALTDVTLWGLDRESFLPSVTAASGSMEAVDTHIRDNYV
jgi:Cyclic nucleotide-binding domain